LRTSKLHQKKYKATYSIGSKTNVSKSRRKKEDKRKAKLLDGEYEPEKHGVLQIDNVDLDVLGLFTSRTD